MRQWKHWKSEWLEDTRVYTLRDLKQPSHGTGPRQRHVTKPSHFHIYINVRAAAPRSACVLSSLHPCECIFADGMCLSVHFRVRVIAPARLDRSWQIRVYCISWLRPLYFRRHGTVLHFFYSVFCCRLLYLYLQLHCCADIMRTWVSDEMKWGNTRLLSASFSGQLLKTAGAASLTGPLT